MTRFNHSLVYRPLRAGIAIWNPLSDSGLGTLGLFGRAHDNTRWLISCYHVLGRAGARPFPDGEPIYQCHQHQDFVVATNTPARADPTLDCAAAMVLPTLHIVDMTLSIGLVGSPTAPLVGMNVIKSGRETAVTEGIITDIEHDEVTISPPAGYPPQYDLTARGDSGSVWIERDTRRPVALHKEGNDTGPERAYGSNILAVLHALQLSPLT